MQCGCEMYGRTVGEYKKDPTHCYDYRVTLYIVQLQIPQPAVYIYTFRYFASENRKVLKHEPNNLPTPYFSCSLGIHIFTVDTFNYCLGLASEYIYLSMFVYIAHHIIVFERVCVCVSVCVRASAVSDVVLLVLVLLVLGDLGDVERLVLGAAVVLRG